MSRLLKLSCLAALGLVLLACASQSPKKTSDPAKTGAELGMEYYSRYHSTGEPFYLDLAVAYLATAYQQDPEKVGLQKFYYLARFFRLLHAESDDLSGLQALYQSLNPLVQKQTPPPSRLRYALSAEKDNRREIIDPILADLIREQPFNAASWQVLSEYYELKKDYWMATAAARRAVQLEPDNVEYMYQFGDSINDVIQLGECRFDQQAYSKRAVSFIAKAAAKEPNQMYLDNTGLQYLRLGLFPLGYTQVLKAWELEKNWWTATHLAQAAILTGKYEIAGQAVEYLIQEKNDVNGYVFEAQRLIGQKNFDQARVALKALDGLVQKNIASGSKQFYVSVYDSLQYSFIQSVLGNKTQSVNTYSSQQLTDWGQTVSDYFTFQRFEPDYLIEQSLNGCEKTAARFYQAYAAWLQGDTSAAHKQLQLTRETVATLYPEYLWAKVLLESGLI